MSFRIHGDSPMELVEEAFFRIQREQMADVPILNAALNVEAVDFQRWQGHWLGVVITPWCMSILLLPGSQEDWISAGQNKRRFVKFPAGDFAFLGGVEPELGEYQSCSLFSPMERFPTQREATQTARASLIGLLSAPATKSAPDEEKPVDKPSLSRRRFFAMR
ncbi:MAG: [NiFe]-hydrogenase assembly chaperone HybE [Comamonadaceae bacterium]